MPPALRKLLAIVGGLLVAAGITWYPWTYWDHFTGGASAVYGMSAMIWAPAALIIGLACGAVFVVLCWPRRGGRRPPPPKDSLEV